jgi:hypothetical protein
MGVRHQGRLAVGLEHHYNALNHGVWVPEAGATPSWLFDRWYGGVTGTANRPPDAELPTVSDPRIISAMYVIYMALGLLVGLPFAGIFYYAIWMMLTGDPGGSDGHF